MSSIPTIASLAGAAVGASRRSRPLTLLARAPASANPEPQQREASSTVTRRDFRQIGTTRRQRRSGRGDDHLHAAAGRDRTTSRSSSPRWSGRAARCSKGDLLVEFDRQDQLKNALDRRVELNDLEQQIRKKEAESAGRARAKTTARSCRPRAALSRAQLEMSKNEMLPKIQAEKNTQALEEAQAKLKQLKTTYDLKRHAAEADLRILQIRRDRAENAMRQAESNAERMAIQSPIGGMAVLRSIWKSNNMAEVQEGEEVRSGMPIVDVVNPSSMRVRAKVNQADIGDVKAGLPVRIGLDAYPELSFTGRVVQISRLAVTSDAFAESAQLHRADRRRRLASQPDAGPHRFARRRAAAASPARSSCRATRSGSTASRSTCASSAAAALPISR